MLYMKGHVDDHALHVHVYIVPAMLAELFYPLQDGNTPLHLAAMGGHTTCVERFLSTPGIDANIMTINVSWSTEYSNKISTVIGTVADIASHYTFLVQMINMQHYCSFCTLVHILFNHYQMVDTKSG